MERRPSYDVALGSISQLCAEHNWVEVWVSLSMKSRETKASVISMPLTEGFFTQGPQLHAIKTNSLPQEKPVPFMASTKPCNSLLRKVWMTTESPAFSN